MPNPNPTSDRALVRYRLNKAVRPPLPDKAVAATPTLAGLTLVAPHVIGTPKDGHVMEEFVLDPPTHSIAEVEKRWREANTDPDKEWVDADLLPVGTPPVAEPVLANQTIPAPGTPTDAQIVRERAAGREELPSTVTEDEDLKETKGAIRPVGKAADEPETFGTGEHKYPLSRFDGMDDAAILATPGIGEVTLKDIKAAQRKRDKAK